MKRNKSQAHNVWAFAYRKARYLMSVKGASLIQACVLTASNLNAPRSLRWDVETSLYRALVRRVS